MYLFMDEAPIIYFVMVMSGCVQMENTWYPFQSFHIPISGGLATGFPLQPQPSAVLAAAARGGGESWAWPSSTQGVTLAS